MAKLGDKRMDMVTGFAGVVVAVEEWLYGQRRLALQPEELRDGRPVEPAWFDEGRLIAEGKKKADGQPRPRKGRRAA